MWRGIGSQKGAVILQIRYRTGNTCTDPPSMDQIALLQDHLPQRGDLSSHFRCPHPSTRENVRNGTERAERNTELNCHSHTSLGRKGTSMGYMVHIERNR